MVLTHQQVDEGCSHVMAHALGPAHRGQRLGSIALVVDAVVMGVVNIEGCRVDGTCYNKPAQRPVFTGLVMY